MPDRGLRVLRLGADRACVAVRTAGGQSLEATQGPPLAWYEPVDELIVKRLTLQRFAIFIAYIVLAVLAAGAFGMVHDQISYTVSPEYFTKFKFLQFRLLDPEVPERLRAAKVGFLASWHPGGWGSHSES